MKVILETDRLLVREYVEEDAEPFFKLNTDPEVLRFVPDKALLNVEQARQLLIATVFAFLDWAAELRAFRPQLIHRRIDVIAHDRDRVLPRVIVSLAFPDAVRRVHTHLARSRFEDQPILIPIFGHILPAEHVPQNGARGKRCDMAGAAER